MSVFDAFIARVLKTEGGYVNDPEDPGGETNWGITLATARANGYTGNMKDMTRDQAIAVYRSAFWQRIQGEELPRQLSYQILDAAVNHGIENAVRWMQRAAGVADDGQIGRVTLAAILMGDVADLVLLFNAERLEFYSKLTKFDRYGRGWVRRDAQALRYAAQDNDV